MIETQLNELLHPLVDGRVYPTVAPQGTSPPYLVYTVVSERDADVWCGQAETTYAVQIDSYAVTIKEAKQNLLAAQEQLSPLYPGELFRTGGHEPDTNLFRRTLELNIIQ